MKKSTKIITTAVALALVVAAMVVGIYAATAGGATITANVSWNAVAGVTFEFTGSVSGGKLNPQAITHTVVSSTTNTAAAGTGNLSEQFNDTSENGVNDPGAITYTYTIKNTTASAIKVKLTKAPAEGAESGSTADDHKPTVAYSFEGVTGASLAALQGTDGLAVPSGDTLTVIIQLSLASGTDAATDADLGINSFDAGVAFSMGL